ncbi:hypothetical protein [Halegenticoccus tardaugens]|uniref:hypothetical protein n=1 Tax=Halegenticoccus tardaugens TaxID=2071624 RepID=UPI00100AB224|nr:hypothetical protein [Halegenticoccus tardaugens]
MRLLDDPQRRGLALIVAASALLVLAFGGSWALAADTTVITPEGEDAGTTLVGVQGPGPDGNVTAIDGDGNVSWSKGGTIGYLDVTYLDNGSVLAAFADGGYGECGPYEPPCKRTGVHIIRPEPEPRVVAEWSYPVRTRKDSEVHDAEPLPSGELLVADMEYESVYAVNTSTGDRSWTWNASSYYEPPPDPTREDWLHINDVDRIGDERYLVSVRNTNQLLVLEREEGDDGARVVEVINEDRDPDVLNEQHNPQWLGDGAVVVADSENDRVVELHRNDAGEWEVAWALTEANGIPFDWPRDADRLPNGNTLVTDSRNDRVVEVRRDGSVVASYEVRSLPYEADRVPVGESAGGPYETTSDPIEDAPHDRDVPVLSTLLDALHHVVPVPYWVSELHLSVTALTLGLYAWGGRLLLKG